MKSYFAGLLQGLVIGAVIGSGWTLYFITFGLGGRGH